MRKLSLLLLFLLPFAWTSKAQAQATPTSTPDCCQGLMALNDQGGFNQPAGMAVDHFRDRLYLTDISNNKVHVYTASGTPVTVFGSWTTGQFDGPQDAAVDPRGNLYIADYRNNVIEKFDSNLNFVASIGSPGLIYPRAVWVESQGSTDSVYVANEFTIFRYDGSGVTYSLGVTFGGTALNTPSGMVKVGQWLYVADTLNNKIVKFDTTLPNPSSVLVTAMSSPTAVRTDLAGYFYVAELSLGTLSMFSQDFETLLSQCPLPTGGAWGVAVNQTGNIFVSQLYGNAVTVLQGCVVQPTPVPFFPGSDPPSSGECFIYPSPVRGNQATLACSMAKSGNVVLRIWNENGELSAEISGHRSIGLQTIPFDTSRLAQGVYSYRVTLNYDSGDTERLKLKKFAVIR